MPKDKDFKRLIRARMQKTGEAYTTARAHLIAHRTAEPPAPLPDDYAALAGMSDEAVEAKTGRTWPEWTRFLDALGASELEHPDIAEHVYAETGLGWWSQTVAVGYERIRGLREVGQRRDGSYEANKSRTYGVSVERLFEAFADDRARADWLGVEAEVRTATPHRSVRLTWPDDTRVEVWLTEKAPTRATAQVQHRRLGSREAADAAKTWWHARLDALGEILAE